jgi:hypothetical protein
MYDGNYMFGKKEFGVKYETEVMDMRITRDCSTHFNALTWNPWKVKGRCHSVECVMFNVPYCYMVHPK